MPWEVRHNSSLRAVEVVLIGAVTGEGLIECTSQAIALLKDTGLRRVLLDTSEQQQTGSMVELLDLPSQYEAGGVDRRVRVAMVMPTSGDLQELARFYETVCVNRGWTVHNFETREAATEWLTENEAD